MPHSPTLDTIGTTNEIADFRSSLRTWLAAHVPADWRQRMRGASDEEYVEFQKWWMNELKDGGYFAPAWDKAWGGAGLSFDQQIILRQEMVRAGAPPQGLFFVGLNHVYHTLIAAGTDEHRLRYLPGVIRGEVWCQGFSEPNAGSDLASLRTRAVLSHDHYVVNGQKIWSSNAPFARWCLLLVRTDPSAPKHKGITYLICDMQAAGVSVRPIKQANGGHEFAEIFFDDVVVPVENRIGVEGDGWRVAQVTLSSERGPALIDWAEGLHKAHQRLVDLVNDRWGEMGDVPSDIADVVADLWMRTRSLSELCTRSVAFLRDGKGTGWESSVIKLGFSELLQRIAHTGVLIAGLDAFIDEKPMHGSPGDSGNWLYDYVDSFAFTIGGGSNEIQRNLISEHVLGLPREPRWGPS